MCRVFQIIQRSGNQWIEFVISGKLFKRRWRLVSSLNQDRTGRHPWADWEWVASSLKKTRLPMISQRQVSRTIDCWGHEGCVVEILSQTLQQPSPAALSVFAKIVRWWRWLAWGDYARARFGVWHEENVQIWPMLIKPMEANKSSEVRWGNII